MLDDTLNDKMHLPTTEWPNDTYCEFMEIITKYQLSNSCGDRLVKLFNSIKNVDKNLFPKITKEGRKFLDNSDFLYMKFKKIPITKFEDVNYEFYYQPIINGIKTLLLQTDINEEFVF
ncbi:14852_t:CDS:1 [Funneliformis geosporum]|nr:14852_t:CDS:1 [Funneliformis geosporum]